MRSIYIHLLLLALLPLTIRAEITVDARFNPPRIAQGDRAQYIVEVKETSSSGSTSTERVTSLPIPHAGGLQLSNGRTSSSQQTSFINGKAEYSVTQSLILDAQAPAEGSYKIPSYTLRYKGQNLQIPEVTLQVLPRDANAGPTRDEMIFLKAELPEELYIGQQIRFDLELYVEENVSLTGLNRFNREADGFTTSDISDDAERLTKMFNGRRYSVMRWPMTLTPIQTGAQKINFELSLTARLPQQNTRDAFGRSPFGRSIFDDVFGRSEQFNVYTEATEINVLPLPQANQPDSFSGAIGDFSIEVLSDTEEGKVGEPIMLSLTVRGSGNFERIDEPDLPEKTEWRSYDPESKFEATDELGLRGSKRFDYVLIPQIPGKLELPELSFSYFDPKKNQYVSLNSPALKLQVEQSAASTAPVVTTKPQGTPSEESTLDLTRSLSTEEVLRTLDYQPKEARNIQPRIEDDRFFMVKYAVVFIAILIASVFLHIRKTRRRDPLFAQRKEAKSASQKAFNLAQKARSSSDIDAFFKNAQVAIRQGVTAKTGDNYSTAGIEHLCEKLKESEVNEALIQDIEILFTQADGHRFGGVDTSLSTETCDRLDRIMKAL